MSLLQIFHAGTEALEPGKPRFSRAFIQWLQSLVNTFSAREIELDIGSTPRMSGSLTLTDGAIKASGLVMIQQAPGPYTDKGDRADESEMDSLTVNAKAADGSATVYWSSPTFVRGKFKFHYVVT